MRTEPQSVAQQVLDFSPEATSDARSGKPIVMRQVDGPARVMYRINMREASGYFLAQKFQMRDKDIVLITNAEGTQLIKFFLVARGLTGAISDIKKTSGD